MSYNSSEYLYGGQEYIQISPEYSKNEDEEDEAGVDAETEEYEGILNGGTRSKRGIAGEYNIVGARKATAKKSLRGGVLACLDEKDRGEDLHKRRFGSPGRIYGHESSFLEGTDLRIGQNWVEKYSQKQRKIPVVCIKDGRVSQKYMQTAELLRKVHMHNERQVLEERAAGALTLRDLRQVVGLHGFERPSIEIRRNCILVNMPGVRCLILHDKVYYLPGSPITFPVGYDEGEVFELDGVEIEPLFRSHGLKQKEGFPLRPKARSQHYSKNSSSSRDLSIIEKLISITRKAGIEETLGGEGGASLTGPNPKSKARSGSDAGSNHPYQRRLKSDFVSEGGSLTGPTSCSPVKLNLLEIVPPSGFARENGGHNKAPLELNALEICLIEVCKQLWDSYYVIDDTAQGFLSHIENNPTSTQKVYEINDLRKRLDSLRDRIKGVYEAIKEVLDDDDLLVRIEISKFWNQPENWDNKAILESTFFDSEILLECYEQEVEGLIRTVNRLNAQLDDAIEVMQIHLATIRNNFLKGEISLDIVGVCVSFVSAIASIFGMNIQSGLEKNMDIFWFMAYTMITMCVFAGIVVILMFRRLQL